MISTIQNKLTDVAALVYLFKNTKAAAKEQGAVLRNFDPFQARIDGGFKGLIERFFETHIKHNSIYEKGKKYVFQRVFPNIPANIKNITMIEQKASIVEQAIFHWRHQHHVLFYGTMVATALVVGFIATSITLHPVKLFMIGGGVVTLFRNLPFFSIVLRDVQKVSRVALHLIKQPLRGRQALKKGVNVAVDLAYPNAEMEKQPYLYHFKAGVRWISELFWGSKDDAKDRLHERVEKNICQPIRKYEKDLQYDMIFSRISDSLVKNITSLVASQFFRMMITNLTGLGLAALAYWGFHYFVDLPTDHCEWYTPIWYSLNRVFLINRLFHFEEQCHRYTYLIWGSDMTKWALRFYIWDKMMRYWVENHDQFVDKLMKPIISKSHQVWEQIGIKAGKTKDLAHDFVAKLFGGKGNDHELKHKNHCLPPAYLFNPNLVRVTILESRRSEKRLRKVIPLTSAA